LKLACFWSCFTFNKTARFPDKKETGLLVDINIRKILGRSGGGVLRLVERGQRRPPALCWAPFFSPLKRGDESAMAVFIADISLIG